MMAAYFQIFDISPAIAILLLLLLITSPLFIQVAVALIQKDRSKKPPPIPSAFPVIDGPGHFQVIGVHRATREDRAITVQAASSANARVKAELDGIIVTEVRRV